MKSTRYSFLIPLFLVILFFLLVAPGIRWGVPGQWHPDELIKKVDNALAGREQFDTVNFDYPSLPKYIMLVVSKAAIALGAQRAGIMLAARLASVVLGALCVLLAYAITRRMGGSPLAGGLAGLLVISSSEMALNARFAHNDIYLAFFTSLTAFSLVSFWRTRNKLWLYFAFLCVGFSASSKYNGASLIVAPLVVYLLAQLGTYKKNLLNIFETLFIGLALSGAGYVIGTPRAILAMRFYFENALPAIFRHASYDRQPGDLIGFAGQWQVLVGALGLLAFVFFLGAVAWFAVRAILLAARKIDEDPQKIRMALILLGVIVLCDLPIMLSYNYQPRFFLPMLPLLACLAALWVEDLYTIGKRRGQVWAARLAIAAALVVVGAGLVRDASIFLLFQNDARLPASEFIKTLPKESSIEFTLYPPTLPVKYFAAKHAYPIFFKKFPDQVPPVSEDYPYNQGEAGLQARRTDYLVIDSFTYERFADDYLCQNHLVECRFFQRLRSGQTSYERIASFHYDLPAFLPDLSPAFVNPTIEVYQRKPANP